MLTTKPLCIFKILPILIFLSISTKNYAQQPKDSLAYPKIGLVLSGGGAKGLAHIYVLKALDSVGLHVDNISGTSVGAVVGGIYAAGYKARDIERIAKTIDWDILLSDDVPIKDLSIEEKHRNKKYAIHLSLKEEGIYKDGSLFSGQGLWKQFSQLLFPVMHIKDFDKLPVAFRASTTQIATGEGKLLKSGNLLESIRASMAVPVVFSPVKINDTLLVDGGIVRNLPVQEAIDMGSDYVIGVSLTKGGYWHHEFDTPSKYLDAMIFYNSAKDYDKQKELCNYFYEYDFKDYSSGSFDKIDEIMEIGRKSFDSLYHKFKRVKDSLDILYGPTQKVRKKVERKHSYTIDAIVVDGLKPYHAESFLELIDLEKGKSYDFETLQIAIDKVYSSNRYKSMYYNLKKISPNRYELEFKVIQKPSAYIDVGLYYSGFEGINLLGNFRKYGLTSRQSKSYLGLSIGKNFRLKTNHIQPITKNNKIGIKPFIELENVALDFIDPTDEKQGEYKQRQFSYGASLLTLNNAKWQLGVQWNVNRLAINPKFFIDYVVDGHNSLASLSSYYEFNTLNSAVFPRKGVRLFLNLGYVYKQNNHLNVASRDEGSISFSSLGLQFKPYQKINFDLDTYFPISHKITGQAQLQVNANFNYQQNYVDNYIIGGLQKTFYNQVTFIGLPESSIATPSFASALFRLRYNFDKKYFVNAAANFATYNFLDENNSFDYQNSISGFNTTFNYLSKIGPFQFSLVYTPRNNNWSTLFYFGIPLN